MFEIHDHSLRFKSSSNPARCHFFASQNIPIIAEAIPSNSMIIDDDKSGFLFFNSFDLLSSLESASRLSMEQRRLMSSLVLTKFDTITTHMYSKFHNFVLSFSPASVHSLASKGPSRLRIALLLMVSKLYLRSSFLNIPLKFSRFFTSHTSS